MSPPPPRLSLGGARDHQMALPAIFPSQPRGDKALVIRGTSLWPVGSRGWRRPLGPECAPLGKERGTGTQLPPTAAQALVASAGMGLTPSRCSAGKGRCPLVQRERGAWHLIPTGHWTLISLWGPTLMTWSLPEDTPSPDTFLLEVGDCAPLLHGRPVRVCVLTARPPVGAPSVSAS